MRLYERLGGREALESLLWAFYEGLMRDPRIAPVFERFIGPWGEAAWKPHLGRVLAFWVQVTGGPREYAGEAGIAHINRGIRPEHFEVWLEHWWKTLSAHFPEKEARELYTIASKMRPGMQALALEGTSAIPVRKK